MTFAMRKTSQKERRKGFALISILLASVMGIGAMSMGVYFYQETSAKKQTNDLSQSFNMIGATISNRMDVINRYRDRGGIDPRIILGIDGLPGFTFGPDGQMSQPWARDGVSLSWLQENVVQFSLQGVSKRNCKRIVPQMWGTTYNPSYNAYAMIGGHLISATSTSAIDAINRFCHEGVSVGVVVAIDRLAAAEAIGDDAPIVVASNDPADGSGPGASTAGGATPSPTTPPPTTTTPPSTTPPTTTTPDPADPGPGAGETTGGTTTTDPGTPRDPGGATGSESGTTETPTGETDPGETGSTPASGDQGTPSDPGPGSTSQPGSNTDPAAGGSDGGSTTPSDPGSVSGGDEQTPTGGTDGGSDTGGSTGGSTTPAPGTIDNPIPLELKWPNGKGTAGKTVTSNNLAVLPDGTSVAFQNLKVWGEGDPTLRLSNGKRGAEGQVGSHTNVQIGRGECGATGVFYLQDQAGTIYSYNVGSVGCK